ncbi:hypothetical protein [Candidatus Phytoplasma solani]|uniref:hypothetical protein n=1 Tax=Candidatus Phytoplasma solani TaxID=69896 RepID=UPI00358DEDEC
MFNFYKKLSTSQTRILLFLSFGLLVVMCFLVFGAMKLTEEKPFSTKIEKKTPLASISNYSSIFKVTDKSKEKELTTKDKNKYTDNMRTPFPADLVGDSTFENDKHAHVVQSVIEVKLDPKKQNGTPADMNDFINRYKGTTPHLGITPRVLLKKEKNATDTNVNDLELSNLQATVMTKDGNNQNEKPENIMVLDLRTNRKKKSNKNNVIEDVFEINNEKAFPKIPFDTKDSKATITQTLNKWNDYSKKEENKDPVLNPPKIIDTLKILNDNNSPETLQAVDIWCLVSLQQLVALDDDVKIALWKNAKDIKDESDTNNTQYLEDFNKNYENEITLSIDFYLSDDKGNPQTGTKILDTANIKLENKDYQRPPVESGPTGGRKIKITNTKPQVRTKEETIIQQAS